VTPPQPSEERRRSLSRFIMSGVKRVLITGGSGTGKSTVVAAPAARGYKAIDADEPGFSDVLRGRKPS
jgi:predicted ATPase